MSAARLALTLDSRRMDMLTTQIRLATAEDALAIHELHTASVKGLCKGAYSLEIIDGWLKGRSPDGYKGIAKAEMYVIESDGRIMGFSHVVPGEIVARMGDVRAESA